MHLVWQLGGECESVGHRDGWKKAGHRQGRRQTPANACDIVTANVTSHGPLGQYLGALTEHNSQAAVVFVQEHRALNYKLGEVLAAARDEGWAGAWAPAAATTRGSSGGVAVLARTDVVVSHGPGTHDVYIVPARIVAAHVHWGIRGGWVCLPAYFIVGDSGWVESFALLWKVVQYFKNVEQQGHAWMLAGDFNAELEQVLNADMLQRLGARQLASERQTCLQTAPGRCLGFFVVAWDPVMWGIEEEVLGRHGIAGEAKRPCYSQGKGVGCKWQKVGWQPPLKRRRTSERTNAYSVAKQWMQHMQSIRGVQAKWRERTGGPMAPDTAEKVQQPLDELAKESTRSHANISKRGDAGRYLEAGEWSFFRVVRIVCPLARAPETDGGVEVSAPKNTITRIRGRARKPVSDQRLREHEAGASHASGRRKGRSSVGPAFDHNLVAEVAAAFGHGSVTLCIDIRKFFDVVCPSILMFEGARAGFPPWLLRVMLCACQQPRRARAFGNASDAYQFAQGVIAGCAHATTALVVLTKRAMVRASDPTSGARPRQLMGEIGVQKICYGDCDLRAMARVSQALMQDLVDLVLPVQTTKMGVVATAASLKRRFTPVAAKTQAKVQQWMRNLGHELRAMRPQRHQERARLKVLKGPKRRVASFAKTAGRAIGKLQLAGTAPLALHWAAAGGSGRLVLDSLAYKQRGRWHQRPGLARQAEGGPGELPAVPALMQATRERLRCGDPARDGAPDDAIELEPRIPGERAAGQYPPRMTTEVPEAREVSWAVVQASNDGYAIRARYGIVPGPVRTAPRAQRYAALQVVAALPQGSCRLLEFARVPSHLSPEEAVERGLESACWHGSFWADLSAALAIAEHQPPDSKGRNLELLFASTLQTARFGAWAASRVAQVGARDPPPDGQRGPRRQRSPPQPRITQPEHVQIGARGDGIMCLRRGKRAGATPTMRRLGATACRATRFGCLRAVAVAGVDDIAQAGAAPQPARLNRGAGRVGEARPEDLSEKARRLLQVAVLLRERLVAMMAGPAPRGAVDARAAAKSGCPAMKVEAEVFDPGGGVQGGAEDARAEVLAPFGVERSLEGPAPRGATVVMTAASAGCATLKDDVDSCQNVDSALVADHAMAGEELDRPDRPVCGRVRTTRQFYLDMSYDMRDWAALWFEGNMLRVGDEASWQEQCEAFIGAMLREGINAPLQAILLNWFPGRSLKSIVAKLFSSAWWQSAGRRDASFTGLYEATSEERLRPAGRHQREFDNVKAMFSRALQRRQECQRLLRKPVADLEAAPSRVAMKRGDALTSSAPGRLDACSASPGAARGGDALAPGAPERLDACSATPGRPRGGEPRFRRPRQAVLGSLPPGTPEGRTPEKRVPPSEDKRGKPLMKDSIEFVNDVSPDLPSAMGDSQSVSTMLYHLLTNAFKFTTQGSVKIYAEKVKQPPGISISVQDTGCGIAAQHIDRMLEPFQQEDPSEARKHDGIGIGLAIVREVVRLHSGELAIRSLQGEGSTFTVSLPFQPKPASGPPATGAAMAAKAKSAKQHEDLDFGGDGFVRQQTASAKEVPPGPLGPQACL
ncbi:unnamed protein product [Prorocentrum cordatum]|uniref:histidine kinase n=1 Tax=Prorocentrum cordatum TaxID=2364126 RepID=A0ABN9SSX6_9DINO|nr:unnamed protein product [Polarella glacialis]